MSWQAYVDSTLVGSGTIDKAAIFSIAGDSVWAHSKGFEVDATELKEIVAAYKDPSKVQAEGLYVAGQRHVFLKHDGRSLYVKQGKEGIIIVQTKQALLIGHYPATVQPGAATTTVEQLADYLIGSGY